MNRNVLIISASIVVVILLFLVSLVFRRGCGINGCYNHCQEDSDCLFYDDKATFTCRNLDYEHSWERFRARLSFDDNRNLWDVDAVTCVCEKPDIITANTVGSCRPVINQN